MGVFKSARFIPISVPDLSIVADEVARHFQAENYDVAKERTIAGVWDISIRKGGVFREVLGMKTALKIAIEPSGPGTQATASVGIFGKEVIPTVISFLFFWPVIVTQIWGLIQDARLDHQALDCVEQSVKAHAQVAGGTTADTSDALASGVRFCTKCGSKLDRPAKFCPNCGTKQE